MTAAAPRTIVVTGAARGIGLALCGHLHDAGHRVIACCREPTAAPELTACGVEVVALDVTAPDSITAAAATISRTARHVDVLVNNAGIKQAPGHTWGASAGPMPSLDGDALLSVLRTNVVGALLVTQALRPLLAGGGAVVNVSSQLGSFATGVDVDYAYNVSKAALNMATVTMHRDLTAVGITAVAVNPGWIRTTMGGDEAPLDVSRATAELAALVARVDASFGGRFVDRHGAPAAW